MDVQTPLQSTMISGLVLAQEAHILGAGDQLRDLLLAALSLGATYAFIALGYTMVYGIIKLINFAHGEFFMMGTFAALWVVNFSGLMEIPTAVGPLTTWIVAFIIAGLFAGTLAVTTERVAYRPLRGGRATFTTAAVVGALGLFLITVPLPILRGAATEGGFVLAWLIAVASSLGGGFFAKRIGAKALENRRRDLPVSIGYMAVLLATVAATAVVPLIVSAVGFAMVAKGAIVPPSIDGTQRIIGIVALIVGAWLFVGKSGVNVVAVLVRRPALLQPAAPPSTDTVSASGGTDSNTSTGTGTSTVVSPSRLKWAERVATWIHTPPPPRKPVGRIAALLTAVGMSLLLVNFGNRLFTPDQRAFRPTRHYYPLDQIDTLAVGARLDGELSLERHHEPLVRQKMEIPHREFERLRQLVATAQTFELPAIADDERQRMRQWLDTRVKPVEFVDPDRIHAVLRFLAGHAPLPSGETASEIEQSLRRWLREMLLATEATVTAETLQWLDTRLATHPGDAVRLTAQETDRLRQIISAAYDRHRGAALSAEFSQWLADLRRGPITAERRPAFESLVSQADHTRVVALRNVAPEYRIQQSEQVAQVTAEELEQIRAAAAQVRADTADKPPRFYTTILIPQTTQRMLVLMLLAASMAGLWYLVNFTKSGKAMRAVSYDADAAKLMGINSDRIIAFTFFVGAFLAGLGGVCYGYITPIKPDMGFHPGLKAFVAAVIGGIGSIPGAVVGGFLLAFVEYAVQTAGQLVELFYVHVLGIPPDTAVVKFFSELQPIRDAVVFALLIVVLVVKPKGLFGQTEGEKV